MVGQPGSHGHHLPHAGNRLNHAATAVVRDHTNTPCSKHPTAAKVTRADPERVLWSGKGKAGDTQTAVRQRAQRELWLGEECGAAQLRGPMLITADFSSTKLA